MPEAASAPTCAAPSTVPGGDDHVVTAKVAAHGTDVCADNDRLGYLHVVVILDNILDRDDGIGSDRQGTPGADAHGLTRPERSRRRRARCNMEDDREHAGRVLGPHREPVHRRTVERRQVNCRPHVLRGDPTVSLGNGHGRGRQGAHVLQNEPLCVLKTDQVGHAAGIIPADDLRRRPGAR